jgi:hypothetical protein
MTHPIKTAPLSHETPTYGYICPWCGLTTREYVGKHVAIAGDQKGHKCRALDGGSEGGFKMSPVAERVYGPEGINDYIRSMEAYLCG